MEEVIKHAPRSYYLKGKWRHIFWPLMAYILLIPLINYFFIGFHFFDMTAWERIGYDAAVAAGWVFFLLIYGIKNNVKAYRTAFIIFAALQVTMLAWSAVSLLFPKQLTIFHFPLYYSHRTENSFSEAMTSVDIPSTIILLATIVVYFQFAFNKRANVLLRIAAIVYGTIGLAIYLEHYIQFYLSAPVGDETFTMIDSIIGYLDFASAGLFYGAISFSRPKGMDQLKIGIIGETEPKWTPPSPAQPMENEPG